MKHWWDDNLKSKCIRAAKYYVDHTNVYVAGRPDYERQGEFSEKINLDEINGWLSVTDRFVPQPPNGSMHAWFPWRESGPPKPEVLFGVLKTLYYWIDELKIQNIFLHCDAGTHRSVTVFGAYLATFHPDKAQAIVDAKKLYGKEEAHHSCPLRYWNSYVEQYPDLGKLTEAIKNADDKPEWGYESLDTLLDRNNLLWSDNPLIKYLHDIDKGQA